MGYGLCGNTAEAFFYNLLQSAGALKKPIHRAQQRYLRKIRVIRAIRVLEKTAQRQ